MSVETGVSAFPLGRSPWGCSRDRTHASRKGFSRHFALNFQQVLKPIPAGNLEQNGIEKPKRMTCVLSRLHPLINSVGQRPTNANPQNIKPCKGAIKASWIAPLQGLDDFFLFRGALPLASDERASPYLKAKRASRCDAGRPFWRGGLSRFAT